MLGHEMELEQLKSEKESELESLKAEKDAELSALLQLQNEMGDADANAWRNRYQTLLKESAAQRQQLQEELQRQHRLDMDVLRSRQVTSQRDSTGESFLCHISIQIPHDGVGEPS